MERRRFGNSDLMVSIIGLGCYGMSGAYGPTDDAESLATIRRAIELGVNFLDTSASYGKGHNHVQGLPVPVITAPALMVRELEPRPVRRPLLATFRQAAQPLGPPRC